MLEASAMTRKIAVHLRPFPDERALGNEDRLPYRFLGNHLSSNSFMKRLSKGLESRGYDKVNGPHCSLFDLSLGAAAGFGLDQDSTRAKGSSNCLGELNGFPAAREHYSKFPLLFFAELRPALFEPFLETMQRRNRVYCLQLLFEIVKQL